MDLISAQAAGGEREIVHTRQEAAALLSPLPWERKLFDVLQSQQSHTLPINQQV